MARSPRAAKRPAMKFSGRGFRAAGAIPKFESARKTRRSRKGGRTPPAGYKVVTVGNKTRYVRTRKRGAGKKRDYNVRGILGSIILNER